MEPLIKEFDPTHGISPLEELAHAVARASKPKNNEEHVRVEVAATRALVQWGNMRVKTAEAKVAELQGYLDATITGAG